MHHFNLVATVAYVSLARSKAESKASDSSGTYIEILHCIGMDIDCPIWENPAHGGIRRSKSYTTINLPPGTNIFGLLKLVEPAVNTASRRHAPASTSTQQIVLNLKGLQEDMTPETPAPDFDTVVNSGTHHDGETYITLRDERTGKCYPPDRREVEPPADGADTREISIRIGVDSEAASRSARRLAEVDRVQSHPSEFTGKGFWVRIPDNGGCRYQGASRRYCGPLVGP